MLVPVVFSIVSAFGHVILIFFYIAERDFHITTHGAYWEDHNYDIDLEDEDAIEMLQLQADRPHLEGNLCLEDLDLDLRSSVRITRRSAICVVEEPADPDNIHLYHTYLNSVDAREVNEIYGLKIPRNNIVSSLYVISLAFCFHLDTLYD